MYSKFRVFATCRGQCCWHFGPSRRHREGKRGTTPRATQRKTLHPETPKRTLTWVCPTPAHPTAVMSFSYHRICLLTARQTDDRFPLRDLNIFQGRYICMICMMYRSRCRFGSRKICSIFPRPVSWVVSVLHRSCTPARYGRLGSKWCIWPICRWSTCPMCWMLLIYLQMIYM